MTVTRSTVSKRIKRGWDVDEAKNTPSLIVKKLTKEKVIDAQKHGLSIRRTAYILGVKPQTLSQFCIYHNIEFPSKNFAIPKGFVFLGSVQAVSLKYDISKTALQNHALRKNISFEDAANCIIRRKEHYKKQGENIEALAKTGMSYYKAAQELGICYASVKSYVKNNNIEWGKRE